MTTSKRWLLVAALLAPTLWGRANAEERHFKGSGSNEPYTEIDSNPPAPPTVHYRSGGSNEPNVEVDPNPPAPTLRHFKGSGSNEPYTELAVPSDTLKKGLQKLHARNEGEVKLGQLGEERAEDPQVKQLAEQVASEGRQRDQELAQLAKATEVELDGPGYQEAQQAVEKNVEEVQTAGSGFDQRFVSTTARDDQALAKELDRLAEVARQDVQPEIAAYLDQAEEQVKARAASSSRMLRTASATDSSGSK